MRSLLRRSKDIFPLKVFVGAVGMSLMKSRRRGRFAYLLDLLTDSDVKMEPGDSIFGSCIASRQRHVYLAEQIGRGESSLTIYRNGWSAIADILLKVSGLQVQRRALADLLKTFRMSLRPGMEFVGADLISSLSGVKDCSCRRGRIGFRLSDKPLSFAIVVLGQECLALQIVPEEEGGEFLPLALSALREDDRLSGQWKVLSPDCTTYFNGPALLGLLVGGED